MKNELLTLLLGSMVLANCSEGGYSEEEKRLLIASLSPERKTVLIAHFERDFGPILEKKAFQGETDLFMRVAVNDYLYDNRYAPADYWFLQQHSRKMIASAHKKQAERISALIDEYEVNLLELLDELREKGDKNYLESAHKLAFKYYRPNREQDKEGFERVTDHAYNLNERAQHWIKIKDTFFDDQKFVYRSDFPSELRMKLKAKGLWPRQRKNEVEQGVVSMPRQSETQAQIQYDMSLLGLLDYLKQQGDPNYLKTAHDIAMNFIVPVYDASVQESLRRHANAHREQAMFNGRYQEIFVTKLRYSLTKKIAGHNMTISANAGGYQRGE